MGGWFRKPIKSLADIKGLKFRIGGFGGKVVERIGGVPQNIPGGEIYQALEKGTIDAAEWVGPYDDEKLGLQQGRAATTLTPAGGKAARSSTSTSTTRPTTACRPSTRRSIEVAASHAHVDMQAKYDARNPAALKRLVGQRHQAVPLPEGRRWTRPSRRRWRCTANYRPRNPAWKKIYEDYSTFRRDANLWFRFTEAGFDDFMQAQKL